jgi:hypothetical protein
MEFENLFERAVDSKPAMDEEAIEEGIVNPMAHGLPEGYWFSEKREENDALVYEFITGEGEGPKVEIHVKQGD